MDQIAKLLVDENGNFVAHREDQASATGDAGIAALVVQKAMPVDSAGADGDYSPLQMKDGRVWATSKVDNAAGAAAVNIQDGGNTITVDGAVTTGGLTDAELRASPVPVEDTSTGINDSGPPGFSSQMGASDGGRLRQIRSYDLDSEFILGTTLRVRTGTGATADAGTDSNPWRIDPVGVTIQPTTVTNAGGASAVNIQDGGNSITVDGTVTAAIAPAAGTIAKAEDSASANGDVGVAVMVIQKATPVDTAGTDGDYATPQMSAGRVWATAKIDNASGAAAVNIQDGGNSLTVDTPQLPSALVGGRLATNTGAWIGSTAPSVGLKSMVDCVPVVIAVDQIDVGVKSLQLPVFLGPQLRESSFSVVPAENATYAASSAAFTPQSSASDIFVLNNANGTNVGRVTRLWMSGFLDSGPSYIDVRVIRRAINHPGDAVTVVPYDSSNGAVTLEPSTYSSDTSEGALVGDVWSGVITFAAQNANLLTHPVAFFWEWRPGPGTQPQVLRSGECLTINLNATNPGHMTVRCGVEWMENAS